MLPHEQVIPGSMKYDTVADTWTEGPKMIRPVGRYVVLMGALD